MCIACFCLQFLVTCLISWNVELWWFFFCYMLVCLLCFRVSDSADWEPPTKRSTQPQYKMEAQSEYVHIAYTFRHVLAPTCVLNWHSLAIFLYRSSVESLLRVCCWLGMRSYILVHPHPDALSAREGSEEEPLPCMLSVPSPPLFFINPLEIMIGAKYGKKVCEREKEGGRASIILHASAWETTGTTKVARRERRKKLTTTTKKLGQDVQRGKGGGGIKIFFAHQIFHFGKRNA